MCTIGWKIIEGTSNLRGFKIFCIISVLIHLQELCLWKSSHEIKFSSVLTTLQCKHTTWKQSKLCTNAALKSLCRAVSVLQASAGIHLSQTSHEWLNVSGLLRWWWWVCMSSLSNNLVLVISTFWSWRLNKWLETFSAGLSNQRHGVIRGVRLRSY